MLVLTRKTGESFLVGDNVRITIQRISRNRVRVGIEAPGERRIVREEITASRSVSPGLCADGELDRSEATTEV